MPLLIASSPHTVKETLDRIVAGLERRQIEVFARVDHGGGARAAGMELGDEEVLIFGDPRVGTLLMQSDPSAGYELPLRVLAWEHDGTTNVAYRPARELARAGGYALAERAEILARMDELVEALVAEGTAA